MAARFERRAAPRTATSTAVPAVEWTASRLDLVGDLDAAIALVGIPTPSARALLPEGLVLASQDVVPDARHPVLFVMGRQRNVRFACAPVGIDYFEFILALPFVEPAGSPAAGAGPFGYMPRLLLDRWLPTVGGRLLLAYDKRRAVISRTEDNYRIVTPSGDLLLTARFRAAPRSAGYRLPSPVREALQLPMISRRARGAWRYTAADLQLDEAQIDPLEMDLAIEQAFVPGLPTGQFALDAGGGQAFRLRTSWRLTGPFARRSPPVRSRAGQSSAETVT